MNSQKNKQAKLFAKSSDTAMLAMVSYILLILAVFLSYSNVYDNEFVFDDLQLITDNKFLTSWHYIDTLFTTQAFQGFGIATPLYRPFQTLLYLFIYQIFGPDPVFFHLLNIVLHTLNACLLFTLGRKLGFQRGTVFLAALLWALHPVQTEAVTYMSGTAEPLCGAFILSGIIVLASQYTTRRVLFACLLFAFALLSKEVAVVFPVLVMGLIFYRSEKRWLRKTYLKTWPFWLMIILYFLARETILNFDGFFKFYNIGVTAQASMSDRVFTFLATLPVYLQLLVWPVELHMERMFPIHHLIWGGPVYGFLLIPRFTIGLAILAVFLTGIVWRPSRRATPLAWGLLWAAAIHIPQSGLLVPNDALFYEHWLYLPTMGLFLGLGESSARLLAYIRAKWVSYFVACLAILIAALFGVMTFEQNEVWRDPITFYNHILDCGENSPKARINLGNAYAENGQYQEAISQYQAALAVSDDNAEAHFNLGAVLLRLNQNPGRFAESIKQFQRAIEIDPGYFRADDALAAVYSQLGDNKKEWEYRAKADAIRKKFGI